MEPKPTIRLGRGFNKPLGDPDDYPPAAPDKDLLALMYSTAEDAILFRHVFPPRFDETATSFFGGLPRVPSQFIWPKGPIEPRAEAGYPLTFVAQVNCQDLPAVGLRHLLPDTGWLYFFFDQRLLDGDYSSFGEFPDLTPPSNSVMYIPDDGTALSEAKAPPGLWPTHRSLGGSWKRQIGADGQYRPTKFPKWLAEPIVLRTYADEHPLEEDGNSAGRYQQLWEAEQLKEVIAALGQPVSEENRHLPFRYKSGPAIWCPTPSFPQAWIIVEIFAGNLLDALREKIRSPQRFAKNRYDPATGGFVGDGMWPDDLERLTVEYRELLPKAEAWVDRAQAKGVFTSISEADCHEFWSWCMSLVGETDQAREARFYDCRGASQLNGHLYEAFLRGSDYCLSHSAELAALIGDEAREALRWRHAPLIARDSGSLVRHQLLGAGASVQGAPERLRSTHLLLMQFDSDEGMDWLWWDCGMLQYWIAPLDLKARRFDRVTITIEGH